VVDVLTAMNTGHDGSMSTVHANNAQDALLRLETLVGLTGRSIAERTLRQMICAALDVVIQLTRMPDGRRCVSEVVEVVGIRVTTCMSPTPCSASIGAPVSASCAKRSTRRATSCATR
jgi:Flp pilus assembly CpaF family ATPase